MSHPTEEVVLLTEKMTSLLRRMHHLSPTDAKILSVLVVESCSEGVTFENLVEHLGVSKSSISASLNHLLEEGLVCYETRENKRKKYFKSFPFDKRFAGFLSMVREEKDFTLSFREYLQRKPNSEEDFIKKKLRKISIFIDFLNQMEQLTEAFLKKINEKDSEEL